MTNIQFNSEDSSDFPASTAPMSRRVDNNTAEPDNVLDSLKKVIQDKVRRSDPVS